jgi:hypothetical protein
MAFAATRVKFGVAGDMRFELWTFTEAGTDTGGTFTSGLASIVTIGGLVVNLSFACSASFVQSTKVVTIANTAGPTAGSVLIFGF